MYCSAVKGIFRAKGESWLEMKGRGRGFEASRPNLMTRTVLMSKAIEAYLTKRGHPVDDIQSVILFSNPGTHVESIRPIVRVVMIDGMERFISALTQTRTFLSGEDVQNVVESFLQADKPPVATGEDELRDQLTQAKPSPFIRPVEVIETNISQPFLSFSNKVRLTKPQWILLGVMAFVEVIVLIFFIIYILIAT
jgi:hypothetical protein